MEELESYKYSFRLIFAEEPLSLLQISDGTPEK